jgi:hypothetical protein
MTVTIETPCSSRLHWTSSSSRPHGHAARVRDARPTKAIARRRDFPAVSGAGLVTSYDRFIPDLTVAAEEYFATFPDRRWRGFARGPTVAEVGLWNTTNDRGADMVQPGARRDSASEG